MIEISYSWKEKYLFFILLLNNHDDDDDASQVKFDTYVNK